LIEPPAITTFEEFHLWDKEQCQQVIDIAQKGEAHEARVIAQGAQRKPDIRSTEKYKVEDPEILNQLLNVFGEHNVWDFCTYWGTDSLPVVEVLHYEKGDFYRPHTDWSPFNRERKLSMTVQLSGTTEYQGGDVKLYDGPEAHTLYRKKGSATVWPSWTLHEVEPIISGERWALVAWLRGPDFY
jgi:PKHD-type hydroxylase